MGDLRAHLFYGEDAVPTGAGSKWGHNAISGAARRSMLETENLCRVGVLIDMIVIPSAGFTSFSPHQSF